MVDKYPLIRSAKPSKNLEAETWINNGGIDPELKPEPEPEPEPESKQAKTYPKRISLDMTEEVYRKLKRKAFDEDRPMNEIVRQMLEEYLG